MKFFANGHDADALGFLILEPLDLDMLRAGHMLFDHGFNEVRSGGARMLIGYSEKLDELGPRLERGELTIEQFIDQL